jgi:hypothetical protein
MATVKDTMSVVVSEVLAMNKADTQRFHEKMNEAKSVDIFYDAKAMDIIGSQFFRLKDNTRKQLWAAAYELLESKKIDSNMAYTTKLIQEGLEKADDNEKTFADGGLIVGLFVGGALLLLLGLWYSGAGQAAYDAVFNPQNDINKAIENSLQKYSHLAYPPIIHGPADPNGPIGNSYPWTPPTGGGEDSETSTPETTPVPMA